MPEIKLTVIIPIFRVPEIRLSHLLDSVLSLPQSTEVLCIVDGPGDAGEDIVRKYSNKDKRIRLVVNNQNKGVSRTRNIGIELAKGKYITFVDADDEIFADAYVEAVRILEAGGAEVCSMIYSDPNCSYQIKATNECFKVSIPNMTEHLERVVMSIDMSSVANVFSTEKLRSDKILRFPEEICNNEDFVFITRVLFSGLKVCRLSRLAYKIIGHPDSASKFTAFRSKKCLSSAMAASLLTEVVNVGAISKTLKEWYLKKFTIELFGDKRVATSLSTDEKKLYIVALKRVCDYILDNLREEATFSFAILLKILSRHPGWLFNFPFLLLISVKALMRLNCICVRSKIRC